MAIWKQDFFPKGLYYLGLYLMARNRKFKLYWFSFVKVFFFTLNTKSGGRKSMTNVMLPWCHQESRPFLLFRLAFIIKFVTSWFQNGCWNSSITFKFWVERTRQEGKNTMCKLRLHPLKSFLGCLTKLTSPNTALTSLVLHGSPSVRDAMCITTMNKTWVLFKGRRGD